MSFFDDLYATEYERAAERWIEGFSYWRAGLVQDKNEWGTFLREKNEAEKAAGYWWEWAGPPPIRPLDQPDKGQ